MVSPSPESLDCSTTQAHKQVKPRRRAKLSVDTLGENGQELNAAAVFAADPNRFAGLPDRWFVESEFHIKFEDSVPEENLTRCFFCFLSKRLSGPSQNLSCVFSSARRHLVGNRGSGESRSETTQSSANGKQDIHQATENFLKLLHLR